MNLTIAGAGYVGLVSGVCLAAKGHKVTCVDVNQRIVDSLKQGIPHIHEAGLPELLREVSSGGTFQVTSVLAEALDTTELVIIAVGTPSSNGVIDLTYIESVAGDIAAYIANSDRWVAVVVKSTVIPGTTDTVLKGIIESKSGKLFPDFGLGMNPEFLREGSAIEDFMTPDRIVLGHEDPQTLALLQELYAPWSCEKLVVNTRTAELIKYTNNALLATQISAINEIANLSAALGNIDIMDVVRGVSLDRRWNPLVNGERINPGILSYLIPGCGFGGSCFPKDVQALRTQGRQLGLGMQMLNSVLQVNDNQPSEVVRILTRELVDIRGLTVLVLGLAFKPGTDDVRESASIKIIRDLISGGAKVIAHDPIATDRFQEEIGLPQGKIDYVNDWQSYLGQADCIVITCQWAEYKKITSTGIIDIPIFDARRMFNEEDFPNTKYLTIGCRMINA